MTEKKPESTSMRISRQLHDKIQKKKRIGETMEGTLRRFIK